MTKQNYVLKSWNNHGKEWGEYDLVMFELDSLVQSVGGLRHS